MLSINSDISKIWITSDTHYHHKNICRGCSEWTDLKGTRDFESLEKMNSVIVDNINNNVAWDDTLIHLGDWSFGNNKNVMKFRERINCNNIILLRGNHDKEIDEYSNLFSSILKFEEIKFKDRLIVLCHYMIESWEDMHRGSIHLHGHIHSRQPHTGPNRYDVGIDGNNYQPYHLETLIDNLIKIKTQPQKHH